jgi:quercetin dioxygenase-like cupin family protein
MAIAQLQPPSRRGSFDYLLPRSVWFQGALMTIHTDGADTMGDFALVEISGAPGNEPPRHVHEDEDELFFVLEGQLQVLRGKEQLTVGPGHAVLLPRGIPHAFKIESESARWLNFISPAGFEEFFRELGQPAVKLAPPTSQPPVDAARLVQVAHRFGVTFLP